MKGRSQKHNRPEVCCQLSWEMYINSRNSLVSTDTILILNGNYAYNKSYPVFLLLLIWKARILEGIMEVSQKIRLRSQI